MTYVIVIFHFGLFLALPSDSPKNQNFLKKKKTPGDIILHMCAKNYDQMIMVPEICYTTDRWPGKQTEGKSDI